MPRLPAQPKMVERVIALESVVDEMKGTLGVLVQQMQQLLQRSNANNTMGSNSNTMGKEDSAEASYVGESCLAGKKVKLPLFEGDDLVAWITRAEIYFDVQQTPEELRVKLSRLSMDGPTIHWFNLLMETEDELSWEKLKKAMIARYGGRRLENPFEDLSTLHQTGSVEEYVEAFELLSSQVGRLPEEQYLGYFMSGLKASIRRRVRTLNPENRMQMMRMAKDVSNNNTNWANPNKKNGPTSPNSNSTSSMSSTGRKSDNDRKSGATERWRGVQNEEMEERRAKGLCFKCGWRYHL
ncbi:hypothetical protein TSUD_292890 [Trifolium subterraneum]|uniref:Retrotransposon gag domain-containing protein n=1 Tax=Trifolium subterraneum TaxID=3900 RepID=A0A2Z6NX92_TRISU|nr:hypothetical protein TSUD_292890 [Trifolium subterraneum]